MWNVFYMHTYTHTAAPTWLWYNMKTIMNEWMYKRPAAGPSVQDVPAVSIEWRWIAVCRSGEANSDRIYLVFTQTDCFTFTTLYCLRWNWIVLLVKLKWRVLLKLNATEIRLLLLDQSCWIIEWFALFTVIVWGQDLRLSQNVVVISFSDMSDGLQLRQYR